MAEIEVSRRLPWEMREDETSKSHDAFAVYLSLGPNRSLEKTRQELGRPEGYVRHLEAWSCKYEWVERARSFDAWDLQQQLEGRAEARERARQVFVDQVNECAQLLTAHAMLPVMMVRYKDRIEEMPPIYRAALLIDKEQLKSLRYVVEQAGVIIPRQIEVSGRDGKPIEVWSAAVSMLGNDDLADTIARLEAQKKREEEEAAGDHQG